MSLNIAVWRCKSCGCLWRDNFDASVSLLDAQQHSCAACEQQPTTTACVIQWITVEPIDVGKRADPRDAELARDIQHYLAEWTPPRLTSTSPAIREAVTLLSRAVHILRSRDAQLARLRRALRTIAAMKDGIDVMVEDCAGIAQRALLDPQDTEPEVISR